MSITGFDEERFRAAIRKYLTEFAKIARAVIEAAKKLDCEVPVPEEWRDRANEILFEEVKNMDFDKEVKATLLEGFAYAVERGRRKYVV